MTAQLFEFENSYVKLPTRFYARVNPQTVCEPTLIKINRSLALEMRIAINTLEDSDLAQLFSGNKLPEGADPLAMAYAGHQFGSWVPSLGDGRALLLGEVRDKNDNRFDIQLKGSGQTPFSRRGDGRAWLGPVLREYVVSEAMHALGVPTTRSLAAVKTGETVYRERALPGAVLTRVARCHIRVGTFQYFYARNDIEAIKILADHLIDRIYPECGRENGKYFDLLKRIVRRQADLVAQWMAVGFIHGVMNTDNMSLACETIDFGPCAFMDRYQADKVFSSIDHGGRYAYCNQPIITHWNLAQFATTLIPILGDDKNKSVDLATEIINEFPKIYTDFWVSAFRRKLGLTEEFNQDISIVQEFLEVLENANADFTLAFRVLSSTLPEELKESDFASFSDEPGLFKVWLEKWRLRIAREDTTHLMRKDLMSSNNPAFIPRNHQIERAIEEAEKGDFQRFDRLLDALATPYEEQPSYLELASTPKEHEQVCVTYCGT